MKIFVTRYALTSGIKEFDGATQNSEYPRMVSIRPVGRYYEQSFFKPHWHETCEAAVAHAEEMRVKKIASLEKQIERLKKLRFE